MIKEIDKIPATLQEKRQSYREMIRRDIEYAYKNRIQTFEFDGDYNYKYLAQYAREEADAIFRHTLYKDTARLVSVVLKREYPDEKYVHPESCFEYKGEYIKIVSKRCEDRIHVYGQIDFAFADNFYNRLLEDSLKIYKRRAERNLKRNGTDG